MNTLDAIVLLVTLALGIPAVGALLWRSYGPGGTFWEGREVSILSPRPTRDHLSSSAARPTRFPDAGNAGSYAGNDDREPLGTEPREPVPAAVSALERLTEDELLTALALLPGDNDGYRYADSRLAKFGSGRTEDRLAQIRAIRERPEPAPPARRPIPMRHMGHERQVDIG